MVSAEADFWSMLGDRKMKGCPHPAQRGSVERDASAVDVGQVALDHRAHAAVVERELRAEEDGYFLNAEFEFTLNPTLDEALQKGVPLYFLLEFEIQRPRWYWLDEKVLSSSVQYRIAWNALTRQYRVSSGLFGQTLYTLEEVERFLSRVTSRPVARRDQLQRGARYDAAFADLPELELLHLGAELAVDDFGKRLRPLVHIGHAELDRARLRHKQLLAERRRPHPGRLRGARRRAGRESKCGAR